MDIEGFLAQAAAALDTASRVVADMREITHGIKKGEGTFGRLLTDGQLYDHMVGATTTLQSTLVQINRADGTFGRLLRDPALYNRITQAVSRVDSLGSMLLYGNGSLTRLLRSDSLYKGLLGTALSADSAMAGVQGFVQRIASGDGSIHKLMTDPQLYDQFLKAVVDLQTLINAIRLDPTKFKPTILVDIF
jgi:phospholipid/cholesterol/gamma-HCH transport system substrate-binding protein